MKFTLAISALAAAAFVSASASSGPSEGLLSAGEVRALDRKAHHSAIAMEKRYKVYKGGDVSSSSASIASIAGRKWRD